MERKPMTDYCELFVFSHTQTHYHGRYPRQGITVKNPSVIRIQSHHGIESLLNLSSRRQIQGSTSSTCLGVSSILFSSRYFEQLLIMTMLAEERGRTLRWIQCHWKQTHARSCYI